ncbi:SH3 domain-containing protein [Saccharopolyspora taberi]|uniref:SH3 domain-containing protein n=1 Tax=Saccharopolyspora taberi TaxID=60895 RepID=A0ABN3V6L2_9PSEU
MFGLGKPVLYGIGAVLVFVWLTSGHAGGFLKRPEPCRFQVTADVLNVRGGPAVGEPQVGSLTGGEQVTGTATVVDGFRDLGGGRWVSDEFVTPAPGSSC